MSFPLSIKGNLGLLLTLRNSSQSGLKLIKIIDQECKKGQVNRIELESGRRRSKVSRTRAQIAKRGMEESGLSAAEIARHLGVATSSITRASARMGI